MEPRDIRSVLVVDDDQTLLATIQQALRDKVDEIHLCPDLRSTQVFLARGIPDLLILDLALPDGDGFEVLATLRNGQPTPLVVAISGAATPDQAFRLAQLGVHSYLAKPFDMGELHAAIATATQTPLDIEPHLRTNVGQRTLHEVEAQVRRTMLGEALARAGGSRRSAARLLQVSRQLVQHMIKKIRL